MFENQYSVVDEKDSAVLQQLHRTPSKNFLFVWV